MGYTKPETKRAYDQANRDRKNEIQRLSYARNREKRLLDQKRYNEENAEKVSRQRARRYADNPEKFQEKNIKSRHGITLVEYAALLDEQGGRCCICGTTDPRGNTSRFGSPPRFHIDHDHSCCGPIKSCSKCRRGLLCSNCNRGLGCFSDDEALLGLAIEYVMKWKTKTNER